MFSFYDILRRERSIYFVLASRIENTHVFHSRSQFFFRRHIHEFTETRFIVVTVREISLIALREDFIDIIHKYLIFLSMYMCIHLPLKSWEIVFDDHVRADLFLNFR